VPASWSTVSAGEPDSGDWSTGDVVEPESDDAEVGIEAEPAQPVASNAATTKLTSDRELFISTLCKFVSPRWSELTTGQQR
jgi:hypothetical protein